MSEHKPGALDKLVRTNPSQVANFALASNVVRQSVLSAGEALVILPERGAMPVFWAADGSLEIESSVSRDGLIRLPVGSFDFEKLDGQIRKGSLAHEQKQKIVARHTDLLRQTGRLLVVDEVQKGGTITEIVGIIDRARGSQLNRLYVVAAQDTRRKVASAPKKKEYETLASNSRPGVAATVVPMPLVSTDSDVLLNQLWYSGHTRIPTEFDPNIEIRDNIEAETIFRTIGMAARNREALIDTSVLDKKVFSYPLGQKASFRIEEWRARFLELLREKVE